MFVYYLSPNTKASQTVDYALNTGLVLFFLEFLEQCYFSLKENYVLN